MNLGERRQLTKAPTTTTQLVQYAGASGDFNRIHYDQRFAHDAGLPDVIAHGLLTMGFAAQLVGEWIGDEGRVLDIGGRFLAPVHVGDVVVVDAVVERADANGEFGLRLSASTARGKVFSGDATVRRCDG